MTALQWISGGDALAACVNHTEGAVLCDCTYYTHGDSCRPLYGQVCQIQLIYSGRIYKKTHCVSLCKIASNTDPQTSSVHTLILHISRIYFFSALAVIIIVRTNARLNKTKHTLLPQVWANLTIFSHYTQIIYCI